MFDGITRDMNSPAVPLLQLQGIFGAFGVPCLSDASVRRFRRLAAEVPDHLHETFASFAGYTENHREVIARFGRFPHRNAVLGRESIAAERVWLADGAATWGQRIGARMATNEEERP